MNPYHPYTNEKELLLSVADGDENAFRLLFELYAKLLYPFLYRTVKSQELAEEMIQEVMLKVWLNRDKLPELDYPRQWIFRVAANLSYTAIKRSLHESRIIKELERGAEDHQDGESAVGLAELKRHVQEAVRLLPKERRRIYLLSREGGLSREEIAEQLRISPATVKNAIAAALKFIREYLEKLGYTLPLYLVLMII